jgi:hypothetical protein
MKIRYVFFAFLFLILPPFLKAQEIRNRTLDDACELVVANVISQRKDFHQISFGKFSPDPEFGIVVKLASMEAELRRSFKKAFESKKITVSELEGKNSLEMDVFYCEAEDPASKLQYITLKIILKEKNGQKVQKIGNIRKEEAVKSGEKVVVTNKPNVSQLLAVPFFAPPKATPSEFNQAFKKQVDSIGTSKVLKPVVFIKGNAVSSDDDKTFEMQILKFIKPSYTTIPIKPEMDANGLPFCKLSEGDIYKVKLVNNAKYNVVVSLSIDGMSMFVVSDKEFLTKDGNPKHNFLILYPNESIVVNGWFKSPKKSSEFVVGKYDESILGKIGEKQALNSGVITANFHAVSIDGKPLPEDEPKNPDDFSQSPLATKEGASVDENFKMIKDIKYGTVRACIAVRYTDKN